MPIAMHTDLTALIDGTLNRLVAATDRSAEWDAEELGGRDTACEYR
jgi:hypothetical protein